jgi:AcrR family transcriptional regulator
MPTATPTTAATRRASRRPRHDPRESEREILAAAEQLLRECPFREVTVEAIMARTGLKRPAFYAHFRDRYDVVLRVVGELQQALLEVAERWFAGEDPETDVRAALEGVVAVYIEHGHVLRAVADAASSDVRVQETYHALLALFVDATAERIRADQARGRTPAAIDAAETARALVLMNERYLSSVFGGAESTSPARVVEVLTHIWLATLY